MFGIFLRTNILLHCRQLNLYDFQRITEGPDKGSYYHELFVQGRPILSTMMKRNKIKGVKTKQQQQRKQQGQQASPPNEDDQEQEDPTEEEEEETATDGKADTILPSAIEDV